MFGISFAQMLVIIGASAVLLKPKDIAKLAYPAGRLVGRAVGRLMVIRGQLDSVMQQAGVSQVTREVQEARAQMQTIRYEIENVCRIYRDPFTRSVDGALPPFNNGEPGIPNAEITRGESTSPITKQMHLSSRNYTDSSSLHNQAMAYARLAEAQSVVANSSKGRGDVERLKEDGGLLNILPISAENAGLLPKLNGERTGSDIMHEAILESEVAHNAKFFFSQPENQIPKE